MRMPWGRQPLGMVLITLQTSTHLPSVPLQNRQHTTAVAAAPAPFAKLMSKHPLPWKVVRRRARESTREPALLANTQTQRLDVELNANGCELIAPVHAALTPCYAMSKIRRLRPLQHKGDPLLPDGRIFP
jgi:hypothetical protein